MVKGKRETAGAISEEKLSKIRTDIAEWEAGLWAELVAPGPACVCGLRNAERCFRHDRSAQA
jgi:hypothetical protein